MFLAYSSIFTTLDILKHICPHLDVSADSGIFRFLAQLDIFMYIKAYLELMAYSGIFRTVESFRHHSRAIYSES